ncbi:voltage-dependent calcium channel beta subunit-associated regulatory protein isoform X3 [Rhinolophus sinicus]|uniref:voltage-dependent calcium channel beta subunit-associated regulatory protein isoform X3 n=1 Tax=Rhinolophus sinicus TaxID=89399 RepID=UPI003D78E8B8
MSCCPWSPPCSEVRGEQGHNTLEQAPPPHLKMQPTATMATGATTTATITLTTTWDNTTDRPTAEPDPILDNYVLVVVVMSLFVGGTLVVLSGVLLLCRRCWEVHRRFNRDTEEAEKTTTTYLDNGTHLAQDPELRGEDPEGQDAETERFLSTSSTGRRVSFNEAALFEQSRKAQDKGRRYTLTEGDFHHLKNARLTHLHLPPLKIVTIHECDSGEASAITMPHPIATPKASLAIFQPPGKALTGRSVGPSSALPGDPYHPAAGPAAFEISASTSSDSGEGTSLDAGARSAKPGGLGAMAGPGEAGPGSGAGPVLQFFTRLRRHASLDGASPYFKVKKWKLEPNQRASSLDTRDLWACGALYSQPKAGPCGGHGETAALTEAPTAVTSPAQGSSARKARSHICQLSCGGGGRAQCQKRLSQAAPLPEAAGSQREHGAGGGGHLPRGLHPVHRARRRHHGLSAPPPLSGQSHKPAPRSRLEAEAEAGPAGGVSPESPPENSGSGGRGPRQQQESDGERDAGSEQAQTIYRDIWSLRASLELHAATASDQSSNDRDSVRSGDSSGSGGTAPAFPPPSPPPTPRSMDNEASGPRKLLQMDSGYASIEGRGAGDDGPPSLPEKRSSFTSAGHVATMGGSFEGAPAEGPARPCSPRAWPRRAPRRDYSVDEKTDALFHEFLRHDPHFDDTPPITARHRTRAHPHPHVRKQWQQRGRQHSDPGAHAAPPALPGADPRPMRAPLRRGDSVDCPSDTRTGDELAAPAGPAIPAIEEEPGSGCPNSGLCIGPPGEMLDKLAAGLEDRLFLPRLAQPVSVVPLLAAAAAPTSPDHSPA